jgi:hypothetical protein
LSFKPQAHVAMVVRGILPLQMPATAAMAALVLVVLGDLFFGGVGNDTFIAGTGNNMTSKS